MRNLVLLLLLAALVVGGAAFVVYGRAHLPYQGYAGTEQFVDIRPGVGTRGIGERLVEAGIVRDPVTFRAALWMSGNARRLKAGEYRFDHPVTPLEVIDKLARGEVYVIPLTFPEGLTIAEMAEIFASHGFGPASAFIAAAKDPSPIRALDPAAPDLDGYLFPETYPLPRHIDAQTLVRQMVARFDRVLTPELRATLETEGLSVRQAITLASIVEKETARADERPMVAAVYENRLRIGMALQCDPTVIYALQRRGRYDGNLHHDDLAFDSPYNTYRYPGLPPGPIASPGRASIEAALHPADVDYLYFVSRHDGSHEFARNLDDHNRNVQKYQVQYFRERRRKGGKGG
jgi:UPF0755 protein